MKIVIVGGPLTGKTTLLKEIEKQGYDIFQPELFVKKSYEAGNEIYNRVKEVFGSSYVNEYSVDKTKLAKEAYENKNILEKLDMIVNPLIEEQIQNFSNVFIEASGAKVNPDKLVNVTCSKEVLKKRFQDKITHLPEEIIEGIIDK
jgi:dephospho-CoA kinase